jgi:hypothetical protein
MIIIINFYLNTKLKEKHHKSKLKISVTKADEIPSTISIYKKTTSRQIIPIFPGKFIIKSGNIIKFKYTGLMEKHFSKKANLIKLIWHF